MESLAERTRAAARSEPFVHEALRAGVVNYSAAARFLDVEGDKEAVATALRRYAEDLDEPIAGADARVRMERGVAETAGEGGLLAVGDAGFALDGGDLTAVVATGEVSPAALRRVLGRLATADVDVQAAGVADGSLVVVVEKLASADALRAVEDALGG